MVSKESVLNSVLSVEHCLVKTFPAFAWARDSSVSQQDMKDHGVRLDGLTTSTEQCARAEAADETLPLVAMAEFAG